MDTEDFDNETGEIRGVYIKVQRLPTNAETGEPEVEERILRRKFKVPVKYLETHHEKAKGNRKAKPRRKTIRGFYFRKDVGLNVVKEFVLCKRRRVSPIVFMLPTLFICPGWASILCLLGEACMHMWSHKRSRKSMEKISQIQDKRTLRRTVLYPNSRTVH